MAFDLSVDRFGDGEDGFWSLGRGCRKEEGGQGGVCEDVVGLTGDDGGGDELSELWYDVRQVVVESLPVDVFRVVMEYPGVAVDADADAAVEKVVLFETVDGDDVAIPGWGGDR